MITKQEYQAAQANLRKSLNIISAYTLQLETELFKALTKPDDYYWGIIAELGWGTKTEDLMVLKTQLKETHPEDILHLGQFVYEKQQNLMKHLKEAGKIDYAGDDGFSDLTAHIIGLGKAKYLAVIDNPSIAREMGVGLDYVESFLYVFR